MFISGFRCLLFLGEEPLVADDVGVCSSEMAQQPSVPLPFLLLAFRMNLDNHSSFGVTPVYKHYLRYFRFLPAIAYPEQPTLLL